MLEWVAISFPPGDLPDPGIEARSPASQADPLPSELSGSLYGDFGKGPRLSSFYLRSYLCKCFMFIINLRWVTLIISCVSISVLVAQSSPTLYDPMDCSPPGTSVCGIFPGKNTGIGSHSLLQGIFLTQGSNLGVLHCRQILSSLFEPTGETCMSVKVQSTRRPLKAGEKGSSSGHYSLLKLQIVPLKLTQFCFLKM